MTRAQPFLPYAQQHIEDDDVIAVSNVLKAEYLTSGPLIERFEESISKMTQAPFSISCSSGTAALHLTCLAMKIGSGDTVIVPSITFVATANVARINGAEIVFSDVNPKTGLMGPEELAEAIGRAGPKCKAVFFVHLGGQGGDLKKMHKIAKQAKLIIIEDASHAFGSYYKTSEDFMPIGNSLYSDATIFSFHPIKTIAAGEGGAITTRSAKLAEDLGLLRSHGITRDPNLIENKEEGLSGNNNTKLGYYEMLSLGLNYRLSDIHSALAISQLKKLSFFVQRRKMLVSEYENLIGKMLVGVERIKTHGNWDPAWHLCQVIIDFDLIGISRNSLMEKLRAIGIGTQIHYIPVYRQPYYKTRYGKMTLPGAEAFYSKCLSLPLFTKMEQTDVLKVCNAIDKIIS